jgi:hypothetical protein
VLDPSNQYRQNEKSANRALRLFIYEGKIPSIAEHKLMPMTIYLEFTNFVFCLKRCSASATDLGVGARVLQGKQKGCEKVNISN